MCLIEQHWAKPGSRLPWSLRWLRVHIRVLLTLQMEASQGRGWVRRSLRSKQGSKILDNMHMKVLEENRGEYVYDFALRKGKPPTS